MRIAEKKQRNCSILRIQRERERIRICRNAGMQNCRIAEILECKKTKKNEKETIKNRKK